MSENNLKQESHEQSIYVNPADNNYLSKPGRPGKKSGGNDQ
jgi:hypothetical protein